MEELRRRLSGRELQALEAMIALRRTTQQADNALTGWFEGAAGSPARFQILMLLWAAKGRDVPHTEIVMALSVTRATVSGLMSALEHEGLVRSSVDSEDRRKLLASLTAKGEAVVSKGFVANLSRLRAVFASLSSAELTSFMTLLQRVREGFAASVSAAKKAAE